MSHSHPVPPDGLNASATETLAPDGRLTAGKSYEIPAREGRALRLNAGEVLRICNHLGQQVGDFWAFHADDMTEFLSMEHMRPGLRRLVPRPGDALVTNRRRPLLTLLEDSSPGVHDTLIASCDMERYRMLGFSGAYHDNCTDNLRMAVAALGLDLPQVPCPFNLWMNTPPRPDGSIEWLAPVSRPGDFIRVRAEADAVIVLSCCPMDLSPINGEGRAPGSLLVMIENEPRD